MDRTLEALFRRFRRQGDPAALAVIFDRTAPELLRVATHLTRDAVAAEDLVQATWLAAIEAAPRYDETRPLLPWLLGILSNQSKRAARSGARRLDPTRLPAGAPPAATAAVERRELSGQVLAAIDRLDEPYRAAVLLRLRYGLDPAEIAHALGRAPATVRSQIHRGLEKVRKRHPALLAGLAPFIPPPPRGLDTVRDTVLAEVGGAAAATSGLILGGFAVKKLLVAAAAVLVLLVPVALWGGTLFEDAPTEVEGTIATESYREIDETVPHLDGRAAGVTDRPAPLATTTPRGLLRYPAERRPATLHGRVIGVDGAPVSGARITAEAAAVPQFQPLAIASDRDVTRTVESDRDGAFRLEGLPEGSYALRAAKDAHRSPVSFPVAVADGGLPVELELEPAHRHRLRVRVVDATKRPVPGAAVEVAGVGPDGVPYGPETGDPLKATTDADGVATWEPVDLSGVLLWARAPDGREGLTRVWRRKDVWANVESDQLEIVVDEAGRLEGQVSTPDGAAPDGFAVEAHARLAGTYYSNTSRIWRTVVDAGRYAFPALPAGKYHLVTTGTSWRPVPPKMSFAHVPAPDVVEVAAGDRTVHDLELVRGGTVSGRVTDAEGAPVPGARVRATLDPKTSNITAGFHMHGTHVWRLDSTHAEPDHPLVHRWAETTADGAYAIPGLQPAPYRVEVFAPGWSRSQHLDVMVVDGEETPLDHELEPAGVLQGYMPSGGYLGARRVGETDLRVVAIVNRRRQAGAFTFAGLPAGEYDLVIPSSVRKVEPAPLHRTTVHAGRTTYVDLGEVGPFEWRARLLLAGAPVRGAIVYAFRKQAVTDAEGHAVLRTRTPAKVPELRRIGVRRPLPGGGFSHRTVSYRPGVSATLEDAGDLHLDAHDLPMRTEDAEGRPISASLDVRSQEPWTASASARTTANGRLRLDGVPAALYAVEAVFPDGSRARTEVQVPAEEPVVLRAPAVGTLVVHVVDAAGAPVGKAYVTALTWPLPGDPPDEHKAWLEREDLKRAGTRADARGTLRLAPAYAGEVLLLAQGPRGGAWLRPGATRVPGAVRLTLARGEVRELTISLP